MTATIPPLTGLHCYEGLATQPAELIDQDLDIAHLRSYPPATLLLAAIGVGGAIREEWGVRYHHPVDGDVDTWRDTRDEAEQMIAARSQGVAPWPYRSSLVRRFVVVTAPEVTQ